jgi:hypothetical protein
VDGTDGATIIAGIELGMSISRPVGATNGHGHLRTNHEPGVTDEVDEFETVLNDKDYGWVVNPHRNNLDMCSAPTHEFGHVGGSLSKRR